MLVILKLRSDLGGRCGLRGPVQPKRIVKCRSRRIAEQIAQGLIEPEGMAEMEDKEGAQPGIELPARSDDRCGRKVVRRGRPGRGRTFRGLRGGSSAGEKGPDPLLKLFLAAGSGKGMRTAKSRQFRLQPVPGVEVPNADITGEIRPAMSHGKPRFAL